MRFLDRNEFMARAFKAGRQYLSWWDYWYGPRGQPLDLPAHTYMEIQYVYLSDLLEDMRVHEEE